MRMNLFGPVTRGRISRAGLAGTVTAVLFGMMSADTAELSLILMTLITGVVCGVVWFLFDGYDAGKDDGDWWDQSGEDRP